MVVWEDRGGAQAPKAPTVHAIEHIVCIAMQHFNREAIEMGHGYNGVRIDPGFLILRIEYR